MDQNWESVTWDKRGQARAGESKAAALERAKRAGAVSVEAKGGKLNTGGASAVTSSGISARKLDDETGEGGFHHATVSAEMKKAIQQARLAKKWTQAQLATACAVKVNIINDYEAGRAIPNNQLIVKIERALGCTIPRVKAPKKSAGASAFD